MALFIWVVFLENRSQCQWSPFVWVSAQRIASSSCQHYARDQPLAAKSTTHAVSSFGTQLVRQKFHRNSWIRGSQKRRSEKTSRVGETDDKFNLADLLIIHFRFCIQILPDFSQDSQSTCRRRADHGQGCHRVTWIPSSWSDRWAPHSLLSRSFLHVSDRHPDADKPTQYKFKFKIHYWYKH